MAVAFCGLEAASSRLWEMAASKSESRTRSATCRWMSVSKRKNVYTMSLAVTRRPGMILVAATRTWRRGLAIWILLRSSSVKTSMKLPRHRGHSACPAAFSPNRPCARAQVSADVYGHDMFPTGPGRAKRPQHAQPCPRLLPGTFAAHDVEHMSHLSGAKLSRTGRRLLFVPGLRGRPRGRTK